MTRKSYRVKFAGGDGTTQLAGIVDRPDNSIAGDQDVCPVVVFSHCFTCNKDLKSTVRISRAMSELGIAVLRFDMTGTGGSDGDFSQTNFSTNLADLDAAIDFATNEIGPVTGLMGHSFGGAASLATATNRTSIKALITLAAPSDTGHLADLLAKMNPAIQSDGVGDVRIGGIKWTIRRQMLEDFRQHDLPKLTGDVGCPTLVMHSPSDATVRYDHALRIMSLLQSSPQQSNPVSLLTLHGADHLLSDPADIQYVAQSAAAFLHRHA